MESTYSNPAGWSMKLATALAASTLGLLTSPMAGAQTVPAASAPLPVIPATDYAKRGNCEPPSVCFIQTFTLTNATQTNDANEILSAVRNILPSVVKVFLVPLHNILVVEGTKDELALVQKLIAECDLPRKVYRITYTITEMDSGKRLGSQHFSMVATSGQRTVLKQGSKVPIATGSLATATSGAQTQFTYLDIGMNFDATITDTLNGAMLKSKVEQSSIAEEKSGVGPADPVVRQTSLEGSPMLTLGKPLMLGSIDVAGSTRHLDVEVLVDMLK